MAWAAMRIVCRDDEQYRLTVVPGIKPCGLGARDTLRTEVCYPLYGHELDEHTTPIEAGVGFFVALDKGDFNGRAVLAAQKADGVKKKLVAFKMTDKSAPPRPHYPIWPVARAPRPFHENKQRTSETPGPLHADAIKPTRTEAAPGQRAADCPPGAPAPLVNACPTRAVIDRSKS